MKVFLAGGISGNLKPFWSNVKEKGFKKSMKLFLAGCESRPYVLNQSKEFLESFGIDMKLFLASPRTLNGDFGKNTIENIKKESYKPFILESFYYADKNTEEMIPYFGDFLFDSGAFTFMQNSKVKVDWNEYVEKYADFINRNNIEKFFELDIDSIIGYENVLKIRAKLEKLTNKQPIPVWHKSRGLGEYKKLCDEYSYIALGGIVSKEWTKDEYKYFPSFISEAHKRKTKIHGLGFTNLSLLRKCNFDSVDSTAWTIGNRFGFVYKFDGKTMVKKNIPAGQTFSDSRLVALNNFNEWVKFQKYADKHF